MFQILIISYTEIFYDQKKKYLINFVIERRPILLALDIVINLPPNTPSLNLQYAFLMRQLAALPPEQLSIMNELREQFIQE